VTTKTVEKKANDRLSEIEAILKRQTLPSLEDCFRRVREVGAKINNLFHRADGMWQCNLCQRDPQIFFEFAYGPSPADAVLKALVKFSKGAKAGDGSLLIAGQSATLIGSTTAATDEIDEDDLLG
jgi:hypothetical protein